MFRQKTREIGERINIDNRSFFGRIVYKKCVKVVRIDYNIIYSYISKYYINAARHLIIIF